MLNMLAYLVQTLNLIVELLQLFVETVFRKSYLAPLSQALEPVDIYSPLLLYTN